MAEEKVDKEGGRKEDWWRAHTPDDSPQNPMQARADPKRQDLASATLNSGDLAYDFHSAIYDYSSGKEMVTGKTFGLLESVKEKPVALVFGSYT